MECTFRETNTFIEFIATNSYRVTEMSNTSKQKRFRWLFALTVFTASSSGCASWNHHVGKHSMLSYFHKKHHSPYTQCEDCGQIIVNDRYHQCNQCSPQPAFYGFKSTCWNAWPAGWSSCPAPDTQGCLLNGESVVLHESAPSLVAMPEKSASEQAPQPLESNEKQDLPDSPTTPLSNADFETEVKVVENVPDASVEPNIDDREDSQVNVEPTTATEEEFIGLKAEHVEEEESSEAESQPPTDEDDFVYVEKTTPAISTAFELPSVRRTQPPIPVAPASAIAACLPIVADEHVHTEPDLEALDLESKRRLAELKHFLKEARSTAVHLSQPKRPNSQRSETTQVSSAPETIRLDSASDQNSLEAIAQAKPEKQTIAADLPVAKKASLLDRLCPKLTN
jgi:hypothetical protein